MTIYASYTILEIFEVDDDSSYEEIEKIVHNFAEEEGFAHIVNDFEFSTNDNKIF